MKQNNIYMHSDVKLFIIIDNRIVAKCMLDFRTTLKKIVVM